MVPPHAREGALNRLSMPAKVLAGLVLGGIFAAYGFVPAWRTLNTDFVNYYLTAQLYRQGDSLAKAYDWIWFQRQKDHAGIERRVVALGPITVTSAMPVLPLTALPPLQAKRYWLVTNLLLLVLSCYLLHRLTAIGKAQVGILALLAIEPLRTHFLLGQFHILVLLLLALALWLYLNDRPTGSGAVLALAAAIKVYPILFVFYFVRKKQWRAVAGLAGGAVVLMGLGIYLFGVEVNRVYFQEVLPRAGRGDTVDPYNLGLKSFTAVFRRLFVFEPDLNPHPLAHLPPINAVLQAVTHALLFFPLLWLLTPRRAGAAEEKLEFAAYTTCLLLLSPAIARYHYIVLILCVVLACDFLYRERRTAQVVLLVVFFFLACLPQLGAWTVLNQLVFSTAFFLLLLRVLTVRTSTTWPKRLQSRSALVFVPMFLAATAWSASTNLRHIRDGARDYSARLAAGPAAMLKGHPAVAEGRIAFTMIQSGGYAIGLLAGDEFSTFTTGSDALGSTFLPGSSVALVEIAGSVSKIVRVDLAAPPAAHEDLPAEVENGQQPVVSPDGRWLTFIREVQGRGGLWIKSLAGPAERAPASEREIVGSEYDVLEAAFDAASGYIVFSAQPRRLDDGPALFRLDPRSSEIARMAFDSPVRYPALSNNGEWLAYSRMKSGSWQLWLKALHSGLERPITAANCNSISPAWTPDSSELIYATDCGRGLGLTALARVRIDAQSR